MQLLASLLSKTLYTDQKNVLVASDMSDVRNNLYGKPKMILRLKQHLIIIFIGCFWYKLFRFIKRYHNDEREDIVQLS